MVAEFSCHLKHLGGKQTADPHSRSNNKPRITSAVKQTQQPENHLRLTPTFGVLPCRSSQRNAGATKLAQGSTNSKQGCRKEAWRQKYLILGGGGEEKEFPEERGSGGNQPDGEFQVSFAYSSPRLSCTIPGRFRREYFFPESSTFGD